MYLSIGRFGVEVVSGEVQSLSEDGRRVSLRAVTAYADESTAAVLRQQLLGYVDSPDESFVPVVWDAQPELGGYYRVVSVSFDGVQGSAVQGVWEFAVELERVLGYAAPLLELMSMGARRPASHSVTGGVHLYAVPSAAKSVTVYNVSTSTFLGAVGGFERVGATGTMRRIGATDTDPRLVQFYLEPSEHYAGASTLYVGDGLATAVGRQVRNTPTAWRLSNGLIELEPVPGSTFDLQFRMWLSATSAWSPWVAFSMLSGNTPNPRAVMPVPHALTVLRNGPEEVTIRLLTTTATTGAVPVTVDFSLKRGARYVAVELRSTTTNLFGFRSASFAGATATTTDEDRMWKLIGAVHMVAMAPYVITQSGNDVFPNEGAVTNVSSWSFGLGMVEASGGSDDHQKTASEYFFPSSAKQTVVAQ